MRVLIAGGTGRLGTALRRRLEHDEHDVTVLTRHSPGAGQVRWDPAHASLGVEVVENADVVVNVCGSSLAGNPFSSAYRRRLFSSRVDPTQVLAEAIARSDRKPAFLVAVGTSYYGDHGEQPVTEDSDSRGDALLTLVTREVRAATSAAVESGSRTCELLTAPVFGHGTMVTRTLGRLFRLGLGGRLGHGRQYFPVVSADDWVEAVTLAATDETLVGPVNVSIPEPVTNAEFTAALGRVLHRPALLAVPAPVIRAAAGPMAPELLNSIRVHPAVLLRSGFEFRHPQVDAVLREAYPS